MRPSRVVTVADSQLVAGRLVQNLSGRPKAGVLPSDVAPQLPAAALAGLCVQHGGVVVVAQAGIFGAAAVGHEHQVVLGEGQGFCLAVLFQHQLGGHLLAPRFSNSTLVTRVLYTKSTPCFSRYSTMGRIRDSYWLYLVNFRAGGPAGRRCGG